jgi:hypothetical protein
MKNLLLIALAIAVMVFWFTLLAPKQKSATSPSHTATIEYQGQRFRLAKPYATYDEYQDDPDNLDTNELLRIEKLMLEIELPDSFASETAFHLAVLKLKFPGYGMGGFDGSVSADDESRFINSAIEIPHTDKERFFVAKSAGEAWLLVDDFIYESATNVISKAEFKGRHLHYFNNAGVEVRVKQLE